MNQSLTPNFAAVMPAARRTWLFTFSTATFRSRPGGTDPTVDSAGQWDDAPEDYIDVPGHVGLSVQVAVQAIKFPDQQPSLRRNMNFADNSQRHILMDDYYPLVDNTMLLFLDADPFPYEIQAVEHDSTKHQTRLAARQYAI